MSRTATLWVSLVSGVIILIVLTSFLSSQATLEIYRQRLAKRPAQKAWLESQLVWVKENNQDRALWVGQVQDFAWKRPDSGPAELIGLMLAKQQALAGNALKKDFKSLRLNLYSVSFEGMGQPIAGEQWLFSMERRDGYNIVHSAMRAK